MAFWPLEKKYPGYKASGTFHWEDTEGTSYDNVAVIHTIDFGAVPDSVAQRQLFQFPGWAIRSAKKEIVGVWINGENEGDAPGHGNG